MKAKKKVCRMIAGRLEFLDTIYVFDVLEESRQTVVTAIESEPEASATGGAAEIHAELVRQASELRDFKRTPFFASDEDQIEPARIVKTAGASAIRLLVASPTVGDKQRFRHS